MSSFGISALKRGCGAAAGIAPNRDGHVFFSVSRGNITDSEVAIHRFLMADFVHVEDEMGEHPFDDIKHLMKMLQYFPLTCEITVPV
jgi:hypothetical protein